LTNSVPSPMSTGSRPDSFMGDKEIADIRLTCAETRKNR
jgi:hypothetical protein